MNTESSRPLPSQRQLIKATTVAVLVAAVVLVTAVLPAEYGIDPTGLGSRLGLTALAPKHDEAMPADPAQETVGRRDSAPVTDTATVTLPPGKGVEVKARMKAGDPLLFHWAASSPVGVDMHGERVNAAEGEYTSYWLEQAQSSASGSFTAPFEGGHGWYWHNKGSEPVTVTLEVTGYFDGKLYRP